MTMCAFRGTRKECKVFMIIYQNTKGGFIDDVRNGNIADKIEKYVNEIQYHIAISIYDAKETASIYNETVDNLKLLNVKVNKRIPLFLK